MIFKIIVLLILFSIILSLAAGLFYLVKDRGSTERTVKALTIRIALSIALFVLLMGTFIVMHWLRPGTPS